jgi:hypothetical protein
MADPGFEIKFLDDPEDQDHRPSDIYRCTLHFPAYEPIFCILKRNSNGEGETIGAIHSTILHPFLPNFHGIWRPGGPEDDDFILLGDARAGFAWPCMADFKIGTRSWDVTTEEKYRIRQMGWRDKSTSASLGVRLVTMTLVRDGAVVKDTEKLENMDLDVGGFQAELVSFLPQPMIEHVVSQLVAVRNAIVQMQQSWPRMRWYSGSLLIAYDAADIAVPARVLLIDFVHWHWDIDADHGDAADPQFDDGVVFGLDSMVERLRRCQEEKPAG